MNHLFEHFADLRYLNCLKDMLIYLKEKHPNDERTKQLADNFNPKKNFGAIMTCNNADEGCPLVIGAEARFPIKYDDPKAFDGTELQTQKYAERSLEIASEMFWVFKSALK